MRALLVVLAALLTVPSAAAQSPPPDVLPDSVRATLQIELREMALTDQRVRYMESYGTFSPCVADSLRLVMQDLPIDAYIEKNRALRAEAAERTTPAEQTAMRRIAADTDAVIFRRLREIIVAYGWPSEERVGIDVSPVVFLLHAAHEMDAMRPLLLAEVRAGRMPARDFATAMDKARKVRGDLQLYGTGDEYDPETKTVQPPRIASIEATDAARREIGLSPLEAYRLAE